MEAVAAICSLVSTSLAMLEQLLGDGLDGLLDAALEGHRVGAGGDVAQALADQRLGEHGGGGGAVTGDVVGLLGDFLDELGADLLVRVLELDLLGDGHTVVGDRGGAPLLLQHDVAALGAERHLDGVGELVHAALEAAAGLFVERDDLGHVKWSSRTGVIAPDRLAPATDGPPPPVPSRHPHGPRRTGPSVTLKLRVLTPMISTLPLRVQAGEGNGRSAPAAGKMTGRLR